MSQQEDRGIIFSFPFSSFVSSRNYIPSLTSSTRIHPAAPSCDFLVIAASAADDHHYPRSHHLRYSHHRNTSSINTNDSTHGDDMTPQDALNHPRPHPNPHSLSAFTAVSQYPYALPSDSELQPVSEVVNAAVINRDPLLSSAGNSGPTEPEPETDEDLRERSRRHDSSEDFVANGYGYGQSRRGSGRRRWMIMTAEGGRGSEVEVRSPFGDVRSASPVGILREGGRGAEGDEFIAPYPDPFDRVDLRGERGYGYEYDDGDGSSGVDLLGPRPSRAGMRGFNEDGFEEEAEGRGGSEMGSQYSMDFPGDGEADEDGLEGNENGDDGQGREEIVIGGGMGMLNVGAHNMAMLDDEFPVTSMFSCPMKRAKKKKKGKKEKLTSASVRAEFYYRPVCPTMGLPVTRTDRKRPTLHRTTAQLDPTQRESP